MGWDMSLCVRLSFCCTSRKHNSGRALSKKNHSSRLTIHAGGGPMGWAVTGMVLVGMYSHFVALRLSRLSSFEGSWVTRWSSDVQLRFSFSLLRPGKAFGDGSVEASGEVQGDQEVCLLDSSLASGWETGRSSRSCGGGHCIFGTMASQPWEVGAGRGFRPWSQWQAGIWL